MNFLSREEKRTRKGAGNHQRTEGGTVPCPPQTLKVQKCINSIRQCILSVFGSV